MTLIGILIALLCEHMLSHVQRWREHAWFMHYVQWCVGAWQLPRLWNSRWGLLLILLPLLLPVAVLQLLLHDGIYTLLGLPFSVAVLVLCLGPRDVAEEVHAYFEARNRNDPESAGRIEHDLLSGPARLQTGDGGPPLVRGLLLQGHERLFGVLLWFFAAGPVGAVLYRLASALPRVLRHVPCGEGLKDGALRLHALLAWAPARLVALIYGMAGSTDDALKAWRAVHAVEGEHWIARTWRLLTEVGCGALQMEEGADNHRVSMSQDEYLRTALALIQRSLLILLAVFALFTLGGALS